MKQYESLERKLEALKKDFPSFMKNLKGTSNDFKRGKIISIQELSPSPSLVRGFCGGRDKKSKQVLRKQIIKAILATDMSHHFDMCKELDGMTVLAPDAVVDDKTLQLYTNVLVHGADVSAQLYPFRVAQIWEKKVSAEFQAQGEEESRLGIPVLDFMQGLDDPNTRIKKHLGFLDFVMAPLWKGIKNIIPQLTPCYEQLQQNRKDYAASIENAAAT